MIRRALVFFALYLGPALAVSWGPMAQAQDAAAVPTVVELYTSQGCDTCPPADAFAGELARRSDVLLFSLHVDYWDYLGWKDPYAQRAFSERQRAYSRVLAQRFVYTPQMIIDGRAQDVGSDRKAIEHALAKVRQQAGARLALRQAGHGGKIAVTIDNPAALGVSKSSPAAVWLVVYDPVQTTTIMRGELAGQTLASYNIVRRLDRIATYVGEPLTVSVDLTGAEPGQSGAVVVQDMAAGPILAAMPLKRN